MFLGKRGKCRFEFGAGNIDRFAALLAKCMVVVGRKDFAQLNLVFKAVPNAVDDAKLLVQFYRAVHCGAVHVFLQLMGEFANAHWPRSRQVAKDGQAAFGGAAMRFF